MNDHAMDEWRYFMGSWETPVEQEVELPPDAVTKRLKGFY